MTPTIKNPTFNPRNPRNPRLLFSQTFHPRNLRNLCLLFLFLPLTLSAQGNGTISGKVHDAITQEPLVGANVFVRETTLGAATDLDGRFTITN
ncbi:MAG: carboxypeptidase-like regulatory domain-containing protein, partial [Bacteroidota bacterium]|nr:carboxypeptidase-like regulatory domain-containing protein [Bacteroidota bacterium]